MGAPCQRHCLAWHFPAALALVQRVLAELGLDAEVRTTMIGDQTAAERARFVGSPRCGSTAATLIPKVSWARSRRWSVACPGMSIALPVIRRSGGSVMRCCGQPVGPDGRTDADPWRFSATRR
jgi:hypothetical protein